MHPIAQKAYTLLKASARKLAANDPLRMAGATAFFTTFALPPILIIIMRTFGLFFDKKLIGRQILEKLGNTIGEDSGQQVLFVIKSVIGFQLNWMATVLFFLFMLFVATTLFKVIRDSINQVWNIRVARKRSFSRVLKTRAKAVCIILFTGLLFLLVIGSDMLQAYFSPYLQAISPQFENYVHSALSHILSLVVIITWFFILFRFLPDARTRWGNTLIGAVVTGVLFSIGKYALRWLLSGNIQDVYGASGALVLTLLFVFYSSLILYFGAAFTTVWAEHRNDTVKPLAYASKYHISVDEVGGDVTT
jgi:membrane protein